MEDFIPKVITHTMSKHGYRDVTICQTREEYIKKINDIFDEHDNNCNTFSQLDKKYESDYENDLEALQKMRAHLCDLVIMPEWVGNKPAIAYRDDICVMEGHEIKHLKEFKESIFEYTNAKEGNTQSKLNLLISISKFNDYYEFHVD